MKRIIILLLFVSTWSHGQSIFNNYVKGTVLFRDGSEEKGLVKRTGSGYKEIKFKKTDKDKAVKYDFKKVKKIIVLEGAEEVEYLYKIMKGNRRNYPLLLELVSSGKVSAYAVRIEGNESTPSGLGTVDVTKYYLSKNDSHIVEHVGERTIAIGRKSLRKGLIKYFKDCSELVKKLKAKEFKKSEIVEKAVEYYNTRCE